MDLADDTLLQRWRTTGDAEAFRELTIRYGGMVYATCRRVLGNSDDAEDVAQECFEVLATTRTIPPKNLGGWLHRVATNRSISHVRSKVRRKEREKVYRENASEIDEIAWDDIYEYVDEAIEALPDKYREAIILHFMQQQTHEAVGEKLGLQRSSVSHRIKKGVEVIRADLRRRGVAVGGAAFGAVLGDGLAEATAPATFLDRVSRIALAGKTTTPAPVSGPRPSALASPVGVVTAVGITALVFFLVSWFMDAEIPPPRSAERGEVAAAPEPEEPPPGELEFEESNIDVQPVAESDPPTETPKPVNPVPEPLPSVEPDEESGASISGTITDYAGNPITDALVHVAYADNWSGSPTIQDFTETFCTAHTNSEGSFTVNKIEISGQLHMLATATGYLDVERRITLEELEQRTEIDFQMSESDDFVGHIYYADGRPVDGAWVVPIGFSKHTGFRDWKFYRKTDANGKFRFALRRRGVQGFKPENWLDSKIWIEVYAESWGSTIFRDIDLELDGSVILQMESTGTIVGHVTGENGESLSSMEVILHGFEDAKVPRPNYPMRLSLQSRSAITDDHGRYRIYGLVPGFVYHSQLYTSDNLRVPQEKTASVVSPVVRANTEVTFDISAEPQKRLSGRVLGAESRKPLTVFASLVLYDSHTAEVVGTAWVNRGESDYTLAVVKPGRYILAARYAYFPMGSPPRNPQEPWANASWSYVDIGVTPTRHDVTLPEPFSIPVRVVDASGNPLESVEINLSRMSPSYVGDHGAMSMEEHTDRNGRFVWQTKPGEEVWIRTNEQGFAYAKTPHLIGKPGETSEEFELVLRRPGDVLGRALNAEGALRADDRIRVRVSTVQGQELFESNLSTDENGMFRIEGCLREDRVLVNIGRRRVWLWNEPLLYEGPADVDLDLGDVMIP